MFGFKRKKRPTAGFEYLQEVRDLLKGLAGEAADIYVGTVVGYLMKLGKTPEDVRRTREKMLVVLQKYVQAEILLDGQNHGREVRPSELADLAPGRVS